MSDSRLVSADQLPYPFAMTPFKHQLDCWLLQKDQREFALLGEMGTGKSKMLMDTVAYLYDQGRVNGLVVIAPKGVYRNWADSELPKHTPKHIRYKVGIWTANPNKEQQAGLQALFRAGDQDLHVLLMNVEALVTEKARTLLHGFLCGHDTMMAVDESTSIKNPAAQRTKAIIKLGKMAKYKRILTGEISPNGPLDVYSQFEFLGDELLGFGSYYSFKSHYAQQVKRTLPGRKQPFMMVVGYQNELDLKKRVAKHAFIVKKEDCLDLPPKVYTQRVVEMGPKQMKAYNDMKNACIAEVERSVDEQVGAVQEPFDFHTLLNAVPVQNDEAAKPEETISTANLVITQMLRLHQILCGFMVTDDRVVRPFDEPNPRLEAMMEALEQCSGKAIIFATYRFSVEQIAERIAKDYGPDSVVTYYGPTKDADRDKARTNFQDPASPVRFFVANKTGARGITLTQAKTVLYFSNDYDSDVRQQSEDRAHRIGQDKSVTYVDFLCPRTQDEKVLTALKMKKKLSQMITPSNWREWLA